MRFNINLLKNIKTFPELNKKDFLKFSTYTLFFFLLFFAYQKVSSPIWEIPLNSAYDPFENTQISNPVNNTFEIWKKEVQKPELTIEFNPNYIKVDDLLLKAVKFNIDSKYFKDKVTPLDLMIDKTRLDPRWQVTGNKLTLSANINNLSEAVKVLVHEMGHIVDLHYLPNFWDYDPSENFYNVSWASYNVKRKWSKISDFVSWYALTNKYEDFAESFAFFIFHNEDFQRLALKNIFISRKYNFFKKYVFMNSEFSNTSFETNQIATYNWDTTKIPINFKKYLYYIR